MKKNLSQQDVDRASCPAGKTQLVMRDRYGINLKIFSSGKKTFYIRYKGLDNSMIEKKIADASVTSLAEARAIALKIQVQIAQGIDPFPKHETVSPELTMKEFIETRYIPYIKSYKRSWETDISLIKNHILPSFGQMPLSSIKQHHLIEFFSKIRLNYSPGSTNRIIVMLRFIFNLAVKWEAPGMVKNPTEGIALFPDSKKLERFLTPEDAKRLFQALEHSEAPLLKYIVALLLLTGARKNEVLHAKWTDFNLQKRIWCIEFNKSGKPRYVPLSEGAIALIQSLPRIEGCEYAFANPKTKKTIRTNFFCLE